MIKLVSIARLEPNRMNEPTMNDKSPKPLPRQTYTVPETAKILGIGRNQAYEAVRTKQLPSIRIGNRLLVPRAALERMLAGA